MSQMVTRPEIRKPNPKQGKTLWRYMDIHKFLDFIQTQELHFSRLDQMEDPFEGVSTRILRRIEALRTKARGNGDIENPFNLEGLEMAMHKREIDKQQKSHFINCWFQGDRESMGMWNLYSNQDSIAIKVDSSVFTKYFGKDNRGWQLNKPYDFTGGNVEYAKINPLEEAKVSVQKTILKKDQCWQHENEYRLYLIDSNPLEDSELVVRLKLDFNNFKFEVVFHPKMDEWKKKNIQRVIENCDLKIETKNSDIQLK
jgi:hypothetical protein